MDDKIFSQPVAITPISRSYVRTLTDKYHVAEEKVFVIEHGVDAARFYPTVDARSEDDASEEDAGRYDDHKGA